MHVEYEITELHRRLANMVMVGKVIASDYSGAIPQLKIRIGELQTAWLPMLTQRAGNDVSWWPLEEGEQVIVLSPSGEPAQGLVLGAINQRAVPALSGSANVHRIQYGDGAVLEYDREAHHLRAVLPSDATTEIISTGGISISGDLTVHGNISATDDVSDGTRSMRADRDIYNGHRHPGVRSGNSTTQPTTQQQ